MQAANRPMKPTWTPTGQLLYARSGLPTTAQMTSEWQDVRLVASDGRDVVKSIIKGADKDVSLISYIITLSTVYLGRTSEMILQCGQLDEEHVRKL